MGKKSCCETYFFTITNPLPFLDRNMILQKMPVLRHQKSNFSITLCGGVRMPFLIAKWGPFFSFRWRLKFLQKCQTVNRHPSAHFILRSPPPFGLTSTVAAYPLLLTKGGFNQLPNFAVNVFSENFPLTIDNLRLITLCERNLKFAQPSKIACLYVSKVTASKLLVNKIMTPQTDISNQNLGQF